MRMFWGSAGRPMYEGGMIPVAITAKSLDSTEMLWLPVWPILFDTRTSVTLTVMSVCGETAAEVFLTTLAARTLV